VRRHIAIDASISASRLRITGDSGLARERESPHHAGTARRGARAPRPFLTSEPVRTPLSKNTEIVWKPHDPRQLVGDARAVDLATAWF